MTNLIKEGTEANFEEIIASDSPVLVDFWAEWCGPCKMMNPVLEELAGDLGDKAAICKVNVDEAQALAVKYGIRSIPTMMVFKNGQIVDKIVGATSKTVLETKINAHMS